MNSYNQSGGSGVQIAGGNHGSYINNDSSGNHNINYGENNTFLGDRITINHDHYQVNANASCKVIIITNSITCMSHRQKDAKFIIIQVNYTKTWIEKWMNYQRRTWQKHCSSQQQNDGHIDVRRDDGDETVGDQSDEDQDLDDLNDEEEKEKSNAQDEKKTKRYSNSKCKKGKDYVKTSDGKYACLQCNQAAKTLHEIRNHVRKKKQAKSKVNVSWKGTGWTSNGENAKKVKCLKCGEVRDDAQWYNECLRTKKCFQK